LNSLKDINLGLLLFTLFACSVKKGFVPFEGLNGNPSRMEILRFDSYKEEDTDEPALESKEVYDFDHMGRLVFYQTFRNDGETINGGIRYFYSKKDFLDSAEYYESDGSVRMKIKYYHDKRGRLIQQKNISNGKVSFEKSINWLDKGKRSTTRYIRNGKLSEITYSEFDKKGQVVRSFNLNKDSVQVFRLEFSYDENGNKIETKWFNSKDSLHSINKSTFNSKGDEISSSNFKYSNGKLLETKNSFLEYEYDSLGNQSQIKQQTEGVVHLTKVKLIFR
jgi:hypothetical protein